MKKVIFWIVLLFCVSFVYLVLDEKQEVRIACVGDSITEGYGLKHPERESYPAVLDSMLGDWFQVMNFGVSGRTLLGKGNRPYMREQKFRDALASAPDIVTIKLGTNDSKTDNWLHQADFQTDLETLVDSFLLLPTHPKVYLCLPVPAFSSRWTINDSVIVNGVIPKVKAVASKKGLKVIDLHGPLEVYGDHFPDGIHPDAVAAAKIAEVIARSLGE